MIVWWLPRLLLTVKILLMKMMMMVGLFTVVYKGMLISLQCISWVGRGTISETRRFKLVHPPWQFLYPVFVSTTISGSWCLMFLFTLDIGSAFDDVHGSMFPDSDSVSDGQHWILLHASLVTDTQKVWGLSGTNYDNNSVLFLSVFTQIGVCLIYLIGPIKFLHVLSFYLFIY